MIKIFIIYNHIIIILSHILPLILLESIFYFSYISKMEEEIYLSNLKHISGDIFDSLPIDNYTRQEIINELHNSNYTESLYSDKLVSDQHMKEHNEYIRTTFIYMFNILIDIYVLWVVCIPLFLSQYEWIAKVKWKGIFLHILSMLGFMALFEYIFFTCIIKEYEIVNNDDITYAIVENIAN